MGRFTILFDMKTSCWVNVRDHVDQDSPHLDSQRVMITQNQVVHGQSSQLMTLAFVSRSLIDLPLILIRLQELFLHQDSSLHIIIVSLQCYKSHLLVYGMKKIHFACGNQLNLWYHVTWFCPKPSENLLQVDKNGGMECLGGLAAKAMLSSAPHFCPLGWMYYVSITMAKSPK